MSEKWLPVPGYEGKYAVSDQGRVKSLGRLDARGRRRRERLLKGRSGHRGHLSVALHSDNTRTDFQVHHLVLTAFVGPRPEGLEGCHWNDISNDNRLANLRWDNRSANVSDSVRNGTHSMANRTSCPQGHPYSPENTYLHPAGSRNCRECKAAYKDAHREEVRAKGRAYMRRRRALQKQLATEQKVA